MNKEFILIMFLVLLFGTFFYFIYFYTPERCTDEFIEDKILNLGQVYTQEEIQEMIPKIKEMEGC